MIITANAKQIDNEAWHAIMNAARYWIFTEQQQTAKESEKSTVFSRA